MKTQQAILIRQAGRLFQVLKNDTGEVLFTGARIPAKYFAMRAAKAANLPLYNQKQSGAIVHCPL